MLLKGRSDYVPADHPDHAVQPVNPADKGEQAFFRGVQDQLRKGRVGNDTPRHDPIKF